MVERRSCFCTRSSQTAITQHDHVSSDPTDLCMLQEQLRFKHHAGEKIRYTDRNTQTVGTTRLAMAFMWDSEE
jgi:hypothetical protein